MNIIFLDIDGVLNYQIAGKTDNEKYGFVDECINNLRYIIESVPNTKIVVSSSWKLISEMPTDSTKLWKEEFKKKLGYDIIIDSTPNINEYPNIDNNDTTSLPGKGRGDDIALWIENNRIKVNLQSFVILDDNISCGNIKKLFPNNFVNCDQYNLFEGLSLRNAKRCIYILTNEGENKVMLDNAFFISDTHFYHGNIIKYCYRPWNSGLDNNGIPIVMEDDIRKMNNEIISRWNSVVKPDDIVWHLGDFCLGKKSNIICILPKLNGRINLIMGNHDSASIKFYYDCGFHRVYDKPVIINDFFILSHKPLEWVANPMFNIYGHVHDNKCYKTWSKTGCCVCVERHNYTPISWRTIESKIEELTKNDN